MAVITVSTIVNAPIEKVWEYWTKPEHVMNWNFASDDWECPAGSNDLRTGGTFTFTMAAKDKSAQFEFGGTYTDVQQHELIEYVMSDGRKVQVRFSPHEDGISISESFDAESQNSEELQRQGWQAILDSFKKYVESA